PTRRPTSSSRLGRPPTPSRRFRAEPAKTLTPCGVGDRLHKHHSIPRRAIDCRRSEEHTSELQSRFDLVCRLLLEKKKNKKKVNTTENKNVGRNGNRKISTLEGQTREHVTRKLMDAIRISTNPTRQVTGERTERVA